MFAWLRPNDLIWNYWVSNYLLGKEPPAFDILFWNADTTNMPAGLHRDFVRARARQLAASSRARRRVLGTPVDLSQITVDSYVVAGIADHITPWQNATAPCTCSARDPRFVLSTSGHIAALVNPPGNEKATFRVNDALPERPGGVARGRDARTPGTLVGRTGRTWLGGALGRRARRARKQLGGAGLPAARRGAGHLRQGVGACPTATSTGRGCTTSATAAASRCC